MKVQVAACTEENWTLLLTKKLFFSYVYEFKHLKKKSFANAIMLLSFTIISNPIINDNC